ncbi:hypothetical protein EJF36_10290 [Bacillus sp. HMF5848]|uniref:hypothetical protein n=1 Tax=Bacillus sp. HMF5848 TaxID=2495421 RepID=UPI000F7AA885|nr:hypothetical protein [Bacillus sp. HMF5848]RSK27237.1 hypothetical protein EJF36_10290 [Bacillus sp. HMF5848]
MNEINRDFMKLVLQAENAVIEAQAQNSPAAYQYVQQCIFAAQAAIEEASLQNSSSAELTHAKEWLRHIQETKNTLQ